MADEAIDQALESLFPHAIKAYAKFREDDIREISDVLLHHGMYSWSRIPRIYITLRLINQIAAIEAFIALGITDLAFPFTHATLPEALQSPKVRSDFLIAQDSVLTKALDLEKEDGRHRHLASCSDAPFQKLAELGKGGYGYVDKVRSTISHREYARKLIPRGRTFRKDKVVLNSFERKLGTLKRLTHIHIVELVGSYTDPKYVAIIMSPVADCNLADFLSRKNLSADDRSFLRTFYGCLALGLRYLHQNQIRHKDIKPQNVLVKEHHVYLTDFGISLDWSEHARSTTTGPSQKSPRYGAPEVARNEPRGSAADIWSLGCVYLEITTVLCGDIEDLEQYLRMNGSRTTSYHANYDAIQAWLQILTSHGTSGDCTPIEWIQNTLIENPKIRCTAHMLTDQILETNEDTTMPFSYIGRCCTEYDDPVESLDSLDSQVDKPATEKPVAMNSSASQDLRSVPPTTASSNSFTTTQTTQTPSQRLPQGGQPAMRIVTPPQSPTNRNLGVQNRVTTVQPSQTSRVNHSTSAEDSSHIGSGSVQKTKFAAAVDESSTLPEGVMGPKPSSVPAEIIHTTNQAICQFFETRPSFDLRSVPSCLLPVLELQYRAPRLTTIRSESFENISGPKIYGRAVSAGALDIKELFRTLNDLGFAYQDIGKVLQCSYPAAIAGKVLSIHQSSGQPVPILMREYKGLVLSSWRSHLEEGMKSLPLSSSEKWKGINSESLAYYDKWWEHDRIITNIDIMKRRSWAGLKKQLQIRFFVPFNVWSDDIKGFGPCWWRRFFPPYQKKCSQPIELRKMSMQQEAWLS